MSQGQIGAAHREKIHDDLVQAELDEGLYDLVPPVAAQGTIRPGSRVRYRYGGWTGTVTRKRPSAGSGDWMVRWDATETHKSVSSSAWESNLELLPLNPAGVPRAALVGNQANTRNEAQHDPQDCSNKSKNHPPKANL